MQAHEDFEIVLNGEAKRVLIERTDEVGVYFVFLQGQLIGGVRREDGATHKGTKFIARHKVTGRSAGGITRKQAVTSLIYDHYKERS